jgi:hypothetical protein
MMSEILSPMSQKEPSEKTRQKSRLSGFGTTTDVVAPAETDLIQAADTSHFGVPKMSTAAPKRVELDLPKENLSSRKTSLNAKSSNMTTPVPKSVNKSKLGARQ